MGECDLGWATVTVEGRRMGAGATRLSPSAPGERVRVQAKEQAQEADSGELADRNPCSESNKQTHLERIEKNNK